MKKKTALRDLVDQASFLIDQAQKWTQRSLEFLCAVAGAMTGLLAGYRWAPVIIGMPLDSVRDRGPVAVITGLLLMALAMIAYRGFGEVATARRKRTADADIEAAKAKAEKDKVEQQAAIEAAKAKAEQEEVERQAAIAAAKDKAKQEENERQAAIVAAKDKAKQEEVEQQAAIAAARARAEQGQAAIAEIKARAEREPLEMELHRSALARARELSEEIAKQEAEPKPDQDFIAQLRIARMDELTRPARWRIAPVPAPTPPPVTEEEELHAEVESVATPPPKTMT